MKKLWFHEEREGRPGDSRPASRGRGACCRSAEKRGREDLGHAFMWSAVSGEVWVAL